MLINLPFVSLSISDILKIDVTTVISLILRINFVKIHTNSEVVISMTYYLIGCLVWGRDFIKCHEPRNFTILSIRN